MLPTIEPFGLSAPCVLPITDDYTVDLKKFLDHVGWALASGCNSITLFGTTGEGASLGQGDKAAILSALGDAGIDFRRRIVGAVIGTSVDDAVHQCRQLLDADCRALLMAPPFYFKNVTDDGLFIWFSKVFDELGDRGRDVILYNTPSATTIALSLDLVSRLRKAYPKIVTGVKDASGDWPYTKSLLTEHRDLIILVGDERRLAEGIRLGAQGAISGYGNTYPRICLDIIENGAEDERVALINAELAKYPAVQIVKAFVAYRTGDRTWLNVLPPLVPVEWNVAEAVVASCVEILSA